MTTIDTITTAQIVALSSEAASARDLATVKACRKALGGSRKAIRECVEVIREAEAMGDDGERFEGTF